MNLIDKILDFHPSKKNWGMTVYDYFVLWWDTITFSEHRFNKSMKWCIEKGKKKPVYSTVFHKQGVLLENGWFVPDDKSFAWGYDPNLGKDYDSYLF